MMPESSADAGDGFEIRPLLMVLEIVRGRWGRI